jgi:VanZ family protein
MANTSAFLGTELFEAFSEAGFTMELVIEIPSPAERGFMFIANFHDGEEASQLLLGQWKTWLILMNGDDYDHSRRLPRLSVDVAPELGRPFLVTCTSGADGTRFYIDGRLLVENSDVHLAVPGGSPPGRLVLGNSVFGKNPWKGRLAGFAFYSRILEAGEIRENHALWQDSGGFYFPRGEGCEMQVPFDEGRGEVAHDRSGFGRDIEVRSDVTFLRRRAFDHPLDNPRLDSGFRRDFLVNLFGFVPFGFVLMGVVGGRRIGRTLAALLFVTAIGFALSAGIEFAQSWFPARNSSTLDLVLNTTGTALGAGVWAIFAWLVRRRAIGGKNGVIA